MLALHMSAAVRTITHMSECRECSLNDTVFTCASSGHSTKPSPLLPLRNGSDGLRKPVTKPPTKAGAARARKAIYDTIMFPNAFT